MAKPFLRIHLVGALTQNKQKLATNLAKKLTKVLGPSLVIPDFQDQVHTRLQYDNYDHHYVLALESAYMQQETLSEHRFKHLIFLDSLVDRAVRAEDKGVDLSLYFSPRLRQAIQNHLYVYGPAHESKFSKVLFEHNLPVQTWMSHDYAVHEITQACLIRSGVQNEF